MSLSRLVSISSLNLGFFLPQVSVSRDLALVSLPGFFLSPISFSNPVSISSCLCLERKSCLWNAWEVWGMQVKQQRDDCEIEVGLVKMTRPLYTERTASCIHSGLDLFVVPAMQTVQSRRRPCKTGCWSSISRWRHWHPHSPGKICHQRQQAVCTLSMERKSC